mgnify:CR=1 FL=1
MVNVNHIGDSITGSVKGKTFGVPYSLDLWNILEVLAQAVNSAPDIETYYIRVEDFVEAIRQDYSTTVESGNHILKMEGKSDSGFDLLFYNYRITVLVFPAST